MHFLFPTKNYAVWFTNLILNRDKLYIPYLTQVLNYTIQLYCIKSHEYKIANAKF